MSRLSWLVVVTSAALAAWASLWLQWIFPVEDDLGLAYLFVLPLIGITLALSSAARKSGDAWPKAAVFTLLPWVIALTLFAAPPFNEYKWCWPWLGFRSQLVEFHQRANQAGAELGLPQNQWLTAEQEERLARKVPVHLVLRYPLIGKTVSARINILNDTVYLYWGRATFGPMDVRLMHILYASD